MNKLKIFENQEFGKIRSVMVNNEPYFVGKDIAEVLGYSNTRKAIQDHVDEDDRGVTKCDTLGGIQELTIINESGLYSLILSSKLPNAKLFKRWVTSEVLPSIRKNGGYLAGQEDMNEDEIMAKAILYVNRKIEDLKRSNNLLEVQNSQLTVANEIMKPKADYFDELVDRNLLTNFTETANELKVKRKDLINFLLEKKYVYRDKKGKLQPYKNKNNGLFEVKDSKNEKTLWAGTQTLITPKGRETFRILCQGL